MFFPSDGRLPPVFVRFQGSKDVTLGIGGHMIKLLTGMALSLAAFVLGAPAIPIPPQYRLTDPVYPALIRYPVRYPAGK